MTSGDRPASLYPAGALDQIVQEMRGRFVDSFAAQCQSMHSLIDEVERRGPDGPVADLAHIVHRLSGFAGTIGFPSVSVRAALLEALVEPARTGGFDAPRARAAVDAIRDAFTLDLAKAPMAPAPLPAASGRARILIAEDDADQLAIVMAALQSAGHAPMAVGSGDLVIAMARATRPAVILLDVAMPGLDGYAACRLLKADRELAGIPVIFMTAGANLDNRLAGLTLGADEFLIKPVDMRELVLRIELLLKRTRPVFPASAEDPCSRALQYDVFVGAASEELARSAAALAIVHLSPESRSEGARTLTEELRGRDAIGLHGLGRLVILLPELTSDAARQRLEPVIARLVAHGLRSVCAGVTASPGPGMRTVEALMREAEEAVDEARYLGHRVEIWSARPDPPTGTVVPRTVIVAEDDPDVTRIVEAQLRAAGYTVLVAFDGQQTLATLRAHPPDVLVLDLMMPKINGFDVLAQIREGPRPWPRILVLSGRGREQDVVRAFELGADDYMSKPFNPQELMARIARLLKGGG